MLRELLAPPVLAVQLLTAVPLSIAVPAGPRQLGRSLIFFPVVGALLGLALAALDAALLRGLPVGVTSALVLVAAALLTGGLHLDGLMDTCDGLFGGRTRERRLEIMRDSRVGSYGALAGALQLLLKYAALAALPGGWRGVALVVALTCGRWAMVVAIGRFPYARAEGLGRAFKDGLRVTDVALATVLAAAVCWAALETLGAALLAGTLLLSLVGGWWLTRALGGLTGDCYGAVSEVVEVGVLLALVGATTTMAVR